MKKLFSITMVVLLLFASAMPAHAQDGVTYSDNATDSDALIVDWASPQEVPAATTVPEPSVSATPELPDTTAAAEFAAAAPLPEETPMVMAAPAPEPVSSTASAYPKDSEIVTENGIMLVKMTRELSPDADPQSLVEEFEQDGHRFTLREILREELPGETLTRAASKVAMTTTDSDDQSAILAQFPAYIDYEEDGYSGQLALDATSIITEPEEYEAYSYTYTETEEFRGLARNDPALLKTERQGMTLTDVSFTDMGGSYTALVTWQGTATGTRPVSYTTTATYSGEVSKTVPGNILYTYIYEGAPLAVDVPLAEPPVEEQPQEPEQATSAPSAAERISLKNVLLILIGAAYPLGLTALFITQTRKERKARRENREALEKIARFIRGEA